jgi:hypothetical protein
MRLSKATRFFCLIFWLGVALGCSSIRPEVGQSPAGEGAKPQVDLGDEPQPTRPQEENAKNAGERGRIILYPLNRLMDFCDLARFGVNVGPGFGLEVKATDWVRLAAISDTSVGVGFETLRHLPVCARTRAKVAFGPFAAPAVLGHDWPSQFWDVGLEAHLFLIGAHVYINPAELFDFLGGWFLFDPLDDDFRFEGTPVHSNEQIYSATPSATSISNED